MSDEEYVAADNEGGGPGAKAAETMQEKAHQEALEKLKEQKR